MSNFPELTLNKLLELAEKEDLQVRQEELKKLMQPVPPFSKAQMTEEAKKKRIKKSESDFWYWDKIYFPPEVYDDYAPPGKFHKDLVEIADLQDKKAHVVHGPRDHAKTLTIKKKIIHNFIFGKRKQMGVGGPTLKPGKGILLDIMYILATNERLSNDYKLDWIEQSSESLFAVSPQNPSGTYIMPLSEERSSKGAQRGFSRFDFIYVTDFENEKSSFTKEAIESRIDVLNEMRTSLTSKGTLMWEGNNAFVDSAMNHLFLEEELGLLSSFFVMHKYAAWDESRINQKSLWASRYPAKTEAELRSMCKPKDDYDWAGNFQGSPKLKSGDIFPDTYYAEWTELPDDIASVIYVDPNTSMKEKGDTTAFGNLGFSPSAQLLYVTAARCKSYFLSNDLLTDLLTMKRDEDLRCNVVAIGMDGNVTQESNWTNNIINFTTITGFPFPHVQFKHYNVDQLATNLEDLYKRGKVKFPPGFSKTEEGKLFLKQFFGFRLKKAKKKDDAPDFMICAHTFLVELGLSYVLSAVPQIKTLSNRRVKRI